MIGFEALGLLGFNILRSEVDMLRPRALRGDMERLRLFDLGVFLVRPRDGPGDMGLRDPGVAGRLLASNIVRVDFASD